MYWYVLIYIITPMHYLLRDVYYCYILTVVKRGGKIRIKRGRIGVSTKEGLVGGVSAGEAFAFLRSSPSAVLVDVRSAAEWNFVGVPDLSDLRKVTVFAQWQLYPSMEKSATFVEGLEQALQAQKVPMSAPLLFICRSGVRSLAAAQMMAKRGYSQCINIAGGFEGPCDDLGQRGNIDGWKAARLPWRQG